MIESTQRLMSWRMLALIALSGFTGCESPSKAPTASDQGVIASQDADGSPSDASGSTPVDAPPRYVDEVQQIIRATLSNCELELVEVKLGRCDGDPHLKLDSLLATPERRAEAIDTFAYALTNTDEREQVVALVLMDLYMTDFGPTPVQPNAVSRASARRLIEAWRLLGKLHALRGVTSVARVASAAGELDPFYQALARQEMREVRRQGTLATLHYGRLAAWPQLVKLADSRNPEDVGSVLREVHTLPQKQPAELEAMCRWTEGYLGGELMKIDSQVAEVLLVCGDASVERWLVDAEDRLRAGRLRGDESALSSQVCLACGKMRLETKDARVELARRRVALLESAADDARLSDAARAQALSALVAERPDAVTRATLTRYSEEGSPALKRRAQELLTTR